MKIRVGIGYDVHRLEEGLPLVIGGVKLDHTKGWVAHSDGDVLIHAIIDALLGAAKLRDIGYQFPDNSDDYLNIDSRKLLARTAELVRSSGWTIGNVDCTLVMQRPKISPHVPKMVSELAKAMSIDPEDVSVKASTSEKLGFEGREEGATAYAVALLQKE